MSVVVPDEILTVARMTEADLRRSVHSGYPQHNGRESRQS